MGLSRRALIKQTSAAIAALGLTDLALTLRTNQGIETKSNTYGQALAQTSGRKLALLIGIDNYAAGALDDQSRRLAGCKTDVALQRELLTYRFGFLPENIVCLTNAQATRTGIYQAFENHLYNQANAGDLVVFHFSGFGAQVRIEDGTSELETVRSLVPYDGLLPTNSRPALNDISEIELKTLLKQLKTKNITTVLDVGFVDTPLPLSGGLRSRTRSVIASGQSPVPFPLLAEQKLSQESAPFPGVLLRGADPDGLVLERQWSDFNAGAFTYVLTQYLWTAPAPVSVSQAVGRSQETLLRWGGSNQQPIASGSRKLSKNPPIYDTPLVDGTRGEGTIQKVSPNGQKITLWLGGLPPRVLEYLRPSAILTCGGKRLELRSRRQLTAEARLIDTDGSSGAGNLLRIGQPVFERLRVLPKSIDLVVALDSRLERIERVDATSALSGLAFVSSTSDAQFPADCLLAKPIAESTGTLTASLNTAKLAQSNREPTAEPSLDSSGYGLFSLTRSLIPGTLALQEEAIKPAVNRLAPKLQSLLALKMLRLSENRASSQLPVRVTLEMVSPEENRILSRQTFRPDSGQPHAREGFSPQVPVGSRVRYRLFNNGSRPLYYTLINVDPRERLSAFCPSVDVSTPTPTEPTDGTGSQVSTTAASIAPNSAVTIPGADIDWPVEIPTGPIETYVVCSTQPLTRTFDILLNDAVNSGGQRISPLPNPLTVIEALLTDLSQDDSSDAYTLDVSKWATLNFTYQAI
ncbi:MAG: caspase family protein [Phormidesmis sp.]